MCNARNKSPNAPIKDIITRCQIERSTRISGHCRWTLLWVQWICCVEARVARIRPAGKMGNLNLNFTFLWNNCTAMYQKSWSCSPLSSAITKALRSRHTRQRGLTFASNQGNHWHVLFLVGKVDAIRWNTIPKAEFKKPTCDHYNYFNPLHLGICFRNNGAVDKQASVDQEYLFLNSPLTSYLGWVQCCKTCYKWQ